MVDQWAYCSVCERWFFPPQQQIGMESASCPVCATATAMVVEEPDSGEEVRP